MEPSTAFSLVSFGLKGASIAGGIQGQRAQEDMQRSKLKVESARAKQQAAQESFVTAKNFRQSLGSQLAISALRSQGGGSIARQFASGSISNMFADEKEFAQRQKFLDLSQDQQRLGLQMERRANRVNQLSGLLQSGMDMFNFSGLGSGGNKPTQINK